MSASSTPPAPGFHVRHDSPETRLSSPAPVAAGLDILPLIWSARDGAQLAKPGASLLLRGVRVRLGRHVDADRSSDGCCDRSAGDAGVHVLRAGLPRCPPILQRCIDLHMGPCGRRVGTCGNLSSLCMRALAPRMGCLSCTRRSLQASHAAAAQTAYIQRTACCPVPVPRVILGGYIFERVCKAHRSCSF